MLYFELKKIWVKPATKTAMLSLAGMLAIICYFAIHGVYYVNESGENEYGIEAIQTNGRWKSFYLLTNLQQYVLTILGGYIGTVFILLLTMLVSARTKSPVAAVTIPFMLLFLPGFVSGSSFVLVGKVTGLLPDRLLDINQTLSLFYLYEIGGKVLGILHVLPTLYAVLSALLFPVICQVYRKLSAG